MKDLQNETIELTDLEPQSEVKGGINMVGPGHLILPTTNTYGGTTSVNQSVTRIGDNFTVTFGGQLT